MRVIIQRCENAFVKVNGQLISQIDKGLCLLVGFTYGDTEVTVNKMINKIIKLRIFPDENGVMNKNVLETNGSILSVSQFTLYADTKNGNRPSYIKALNGIEAKKLYDYFNKELAKSINVQQGVFGADMEVTFTNMGPTTIILEM